MLAFSRSVCRNEEILSSCMMGSETKESVLRQSGRFQNTVIEAQLYHLRCDHFLYPAVHHVFTSAQNLPSVFFIDLGLNKYYSLCSLFIFQRQLSNIDPVKDRPPSGGGWSINLSNVTGLMIGDNNSMQIHFPDTSERRRHPTAPPTVNLSPPQSGSSKNKKGGVGWVHVELLKSKLLAQRQGHVI